MKTIALLFLVACSGDAVEVMPDAAPPAYTVPDHGACADYFAAFDRGDIRFAELGVRIMVAGSFAPVYGAGDVLYSGTLTLVWAPQRAGGRLGAIGRVGDACVWVDANP